MLNNLKPNEGARHSRKRLGRGCGSGQGCTSGKGNKGQNSRSGGGTRPTFEGGQLPLFMRIPKRGFNNFNRVEYITVNVGAFNIFEEGTVVTPELLLAKGLIKKSQNGLKVLGGGTLEKKLTIKAAKFSGSAKEQIEKLGGTCEVM